MSRQLRKTYLRSLAVCLLFPALSLGVRFEDTRCDQGLVAQNSSNRIILQGGSDDPYGGLSFEASYSRLREKLNGQEPILLIPSENSSCKTTETRNYDLPAKTDGFSVHFKIRKKKVEICEPQYSLYYYEEDNIWNSDYIVPFDRIGDVGSNEDKWGKRETYNIGITVKNGRNAIFNKIEYEKIQIRQSSKTDDREVTSKKESLEKSDSYFSLYLVGNDEAAKDFVLLLRHMASLAQARP